MKKKAQELSNISEHELGGNYDLRGYAYFTGHCVYGEYFKQIRGRFPICLHYYNTVSATCMPGARSSLNFMGDAKRGNVDMTRAALEPSVHRDWDRPKGTESDELMELDIFRTYAQNHTLSKCFYSRVVM